MLEKHHKMTKAVLLWFLTIFLISSCTRQPATAVEPTTKKPSGTSERDHGQYDAEKDSLHQDDDDKKDKESLNDGEEDVENDSEQGSDSSLLKQMKLLVGDWKGLSDEKDTRNMWTVSDKKPSSDQGGSNNNNEDSGVNVVAYDPDIKSLLDRHCVTCHNPQGVRSQSPLTSYNNVRRFAQAIVDRVQDGSMPPNGNGLARAEVQKFSNWAPQFLEKRPTSSTSPNNSGNQNANEVVYEIPAGTGVGPWPGVIKGRVGQVLVIKNLDSRTHLPHTNGSPFPHPDPFKPIQPNGSQKFKLLTPFTGQTYDHDVDAGGNSNATIRWEITQ